MELLLGLWDFNSEILDKNGQTPLWFAAMDGEMGMVRLLLEGGCSSRWASPILASGSSGFPLGRGTRR